MSQKKPKPSYSCPMSISSPNIDLFSFFSLTQQEIYNEVIIKGLPGLACRVAKNSRAAGKIAAGAPIWINRHLHIMYLRQDSVCPLCQEEEDTTADFIAQCSALMLLRKNILADYILSLDMLCSIHWFFFGSSVSIRRWTYVRYWSLLGFSS